MKTKSQNEQNHGKSTSHLNGENDTSNPRSSSFRIDGEPQASSSREITPANDTLVWLDSDKPNLHLVAQHAAVNGNIDLLMVALGPNLTNEERDECDKLDKKLASLKSKYLSESRKLDMINLQVSLMTKFLDLPQDQQTITTLNTMLDDDFTSEYINHLIDNSLYYMEHGKFVYINNQHRRLLESNKQDIRSELEEVVQQEIKGVRMNPGSSSNLDTSDFVLNTFAKTSKCYIELLREAMQPLEKQAQAIQEKELPFLQAQERVLEDKSNHTLFPPEYRNNQEKLAELFSHQVPVDLRDAEGNTLLHMAMANRKVRIIRLLESRGADLHAENKAGETPFEFAKIDEDDPIHELIHGDLKRRPSQFVSDTQEHMKGYGEKLFGSSPGSKLNRLFWNRERFKARQEEFNRTAGMIDVVLTESDDENLAGLIEESHYSAKRGVRKKSRLHDGLKKRADRFRGEEGYGIRRRVATVNAFLLDAGATNYQLYKDTEQQLIEEKAESKKKDVTIAMQGTQLVKKDATKAEQDIRHAAETARSNARFAELEARIDALTKLQSQQNNYKENWGSKGKSMVAYQLTAAGQESIQETAKSDTVEPKRRSMSR